MQEQAGINTRAHKKLHNKVEPFDPDSDKEQRADLAIEDDFMREHSFRSIDDERKERFANQPLTTIGEVDQTQINVVSEAKME